MVWKISVANCEKRGFVSMLVSETGSAHSEGVSDQHLAVPGGVAALRGGGPDWPVLRGGAHQPLPLHPARPRGQVQLRLEFLRVRNRTPSLPVRHHLITPQKTSVSANLWTNFEALINQLYFCVVGFCKNFDDSLQTSRILWSKLKKLLIIINFSVFWREKLFWWEKDVQRMFFFSREITNFIHRRRGQPSKVQMSNANRNMLEGSEAISGNNQHQESPLIDKRAAEVASACWISRNNSFNSITFHYIILG